MAFEPSDIEVLDLTLENPKIKAKMSPLAQLVGFDVFEDLTKPTLFAMFHVSDAIGLLEKFPIIGEEYMELMYQTPGIDRPSKLRFRVYEVGNLSVDRKNDKVKNYTLKCVSEEHFRNGETVQRSLEGTMSDAVESVLRKELRSTKPLIKDPAKGVQVLNVPRLNPLQAIDLCRQRAVSTKYVSSLYVFYETVQGFAFKTIEGLIEDGKKTIGSRRFNFDKNGIRDRFTDQLEYRSILQYANMNRTDSYQLIERGAINTEVRTFDIATKKFETKRYDVDSVLNKFAKMDKNSKPSKTNDFLKDQKTNTQQFMLPVNSLASETHISGSVGPRNSLAVFMQQELTRVEVHGDSGLKAGDMVTLELPEISGTTERKDQSSMMAGNYLIIRLRHKFENGKRMKHTTIFDCVKLGATL